MSFIGKKSTDKKGTVVIPVLNEADGIVDCINDVLIVLGTQWKIVAVDGGSTDDTLSLIQSMSITVLHSPEGRAVQMNAALNEIVGDVVLFLHADTRLPRNAEGELKRFTSSQNQWGRFNVSFFPGSIKMACIAWFMNVRSRITGIATGDQAMFIRTSTFKRLGGFASIPLMEDVEFSRRLRDQSHPFCSSKKVISSSRKWLQEGVIKTMCLMWGLRLAYYLGVSPKRLHRIYYK